MSILHAIAGALGGGLKQIQRQQDIDREAAEKAAALKLQQDQLARAIADDQAQREHESKMQAIQERQATSLDDMRHSQRSEAFVKQGYKGLTHADVQKLHPDWQGSYQEVTGNAPPTLMDTRGQLMPGGQIGEAAGTGVFNPREGETDRLRVAMAQAQAATERATSAEQLRRDQMQQQQNQFLMTLADRRDGRENSNEQAELNRQVRRELSRARVQSLPAGVRDELSVLDTVQDLYRKAMETGERIGWKGVGGLGYGTAAQAAMRHAGVGDPQGEVLRNLLANAKGTIGKIRAGTALSAYELQLLNTYAAGHDESSTSIKTKIQSFNEYIDILRENKLAQFGAGAGVPAAAPAAPGLGGGQPAAVAPALAAPPTGPRYDKTGRRIN
jgi:hypothetical protein